MILLHNKKKKKRKKRFSGRSQPQSLALSRHSQPQSLALINQGHILDASPLNHPNNTHDPQTFFVVKKIHLDHVLRKNEATSIFSIYSNLKVQTFNFGTKS